MVDPTLSDPSDLPAIPGYDISRRVGQGGMGIVYQALRRNDLRWVALKMIVGTRPDLKLRFRREVSAVARLRHPHIVELYDTGEHHGWPYFTMEFVPGGSLAAAIAEGRWRVADWQTAALLVETLARAVQHAHEQGIVHRDLKPGNILLAENGEPKITDFGLAKCLDGGDESLTNTSAILGTPAYMAPEVARGETRDAGPAVDIYALGAILYELLTGQVPFRGKNQLHVLDQIRSRPPEPPGRLCPNLPPRLEAACLCSLEKEARGRPASALALAEELRAIRDGALEMPTPATVPAAVPTTRAEASGGGGGSPSTAEHIPRGPEPSTVDRPSGGAPDLGPTPSQAEMQTPRIPGFEVLEWLRIDGVARVHRAKQSRVGRTVTLWLLRRDQPDAAVAERFRIEAEILSRLQHPNIVQLIDAGEHDGFLYRVEEHLEGGTLDSRLKRRHLPEREAVPLVVTLARALHYVHHATGELIVHRDLKPGVIRFSAAGVAKVVDFSQAYAPSFGTDALKREGALVGTPGYMAPEQAEGEVGPGTDVYGLGGILYAALTRRPPNGVADPFAGWLRRLQNEPPLPIRQFNPDVSRSVAKVCFKALRKDPYQRHASALELAEDLERALKR
jgi:serine/threonine protein kinase